MWRSIPLQQTAACLLGHDLRIVRKRLVSRDQDGSAALDRTLHALIWSSDGTSLQPPVVLRREEGYPILAYASRLSGVVADCFAPCQVIAVLADLEARVHLVERDLIKIFGLTPAEARLVNRLSSGDSIEEVAARSNISYETCRAQLKSIFHKTNTHRQAQLIARLAQVSVGRRSSSV
jgi:DNA-binding CsgD family transcriptional regulator